MPRKEIHLEVIERLTRFEEKVDGINRRLDISNGRIAKLENQVVSYEQNRLVERETDKVEHKDLIDMKKTIEVLPEHLEKLKFHLYKVIGISLFLGSFIWIKQSREWIVNHIFNVL